MMAMLCVRNCLKYLRSIGVEVSDADAAAWGDTEKVGRWLQGWRAKGWVWTCANGHQRYVETKKGSRKKGLARMSDACRCGARMVSGRMLWRETTDGRVKHYGEDWRPIRPATDSEGYLL